MNKVLIWGYLAVMVLTVACAHTKPARVELKDGFLETDYAISFSVADSIEFQLTKNWLSIQVTQIPGGYVRVHGVGDNKGEFQLGHKGSIVQISVKESSSNRVSVGIRVDDGNLAASQELHSKFRQLAEASLQSKEK